MSLLHRAFSQPLRADCRLLVTAIEVLADLLHAVRDDPHFEQAVYRWREQRGDGADDDCVDVFVGVQPLLLRCLLPTDIAVYASFPCLNMVTSQPVTLAAAAGDAGLVMAEGVTPPSPALLRAVFGFLAAFTVGPGSPLAPLLDISAFAPRVTVALLAQLPFLMQAMDAERQDSAAACMRSAHACSHSAAAHTPLASPASTACQALSGLFCSLGLRELALAFACGGAGHFASSHEWLQALTAPLVAVLPASAVVDACLLYTDWMHRLGAFTPQDAAFHPLSAPRPPRAYSQHTAGEGGWEEEGEEAQLPHYLLTLICLLFSHVDWTACRLSAPTASPLFQRLHLLLHTRLAPLAAQALTVALHRADSDGASASSPSAAPHSLAPLLLQPSVSSLSPLRPALQRQPAAVAASGARQRRWAPPRQRRPRPLRPSQGVRQEVGAVRGRRV